MSTFISQQNYPSNTFNSSLFIMFPYKDYKMLNNLFLVNSDYSSLVNSDEPVYDDSKWNLICPLLGSDGRGFCKSALIAHIILTSSSPNIKEDEPNAWGIVPNSTLKSLKSKFPLPSLLMPYFKPSIMKTFSFSQIYYFIADYINITNN